ncbi:hypothetical protein B0A48_12218 [Cryoendolithus antarcticus]|uniref:Uncharacterized protein n=1 Tax=Cryoendolithus antarcticus TaxID=1507870 RepID=A0A1V8SUE3_9PEZI|nr:hypothetical protein B0A48_12218 [Cryoendolithus antarcticus]
MARSTLHKNISHQTSSNKNVATSSSSPSNSRSSMLSRPHLTISDPSTARLSETPSPLWQFSRILAASHDHASQASNTDETVEDLVTAMQTKAKIFSDDGAAGTRLLSKLAEERKAREAEKAKLKVAERAKGSQRKGTREWRPMGWLLM